MVTTARLKKLCSKRQLDGGLLRAFRITAERSTLLFETVTEGHNAIEGILSWMDI